MLAPRGEAPNFSSPVEDQASRKKIVQQVFGFVVTAHLRAGVLEQRT